MIRLLALLAALLIALPVSAIEIDDDDVILDSGKTLEQAINDGDLGPAASSANTRTSTDCLTESGAVTGEVCYHTVTKLVYVCVTGLCDDDTAWDGPYGGAGGGGGGATTEAGLESDLTDVTDVFTDNDGALDDDDLSDDPLDALSTVGAITEAQGQILYVGAGGTWVALAPGTADQVLKTQGAGANPVWADSADGATTEAELESDLTDVSDVYTNLDGPLDTDDISDDLLDALSNVGAITEAQGMVLYVNASNQWVALPPGTAGQFLETQGAGSDPQWTTPAGGGNVSGTGTSVVDEIPTYTDTSGTAIRVGSGWIINNATGDMTSPAGAALTITPDATDGQCITLAQEGTDDGANAVIWCMPDSDLLSTTITHDPAFLATGEIIESALDPALHRTADTKDGDLVSFDDADGKFTATNVDDALSELDEVSGTGLPNDPQGKVNWDQLINVPPGFADELDGGGAGDDAFIDGTDVTQFNLSDQGTVDVVLCTGDGAPTEDCAAADDVVLKTKNVIDWDPDPTGDGATITAGLDEAVTACGAGNCIIRQRPGEPTAYTLDKTELEWEAAATAVHINIPGVHIECAPDSPIIFNGDTGDQFGPQFINVENTSDFSMTGCTVDWTETCSVDCGTPGGQSGALIFIGDNVQDVRIDQNELLVTDPANTDAYKDYRNIWIATNGIGGTGPTENIWVTNNRIQVSNRGVEIKNNDPPTIGPIQHVFFLNNTINMKGRPTTTTGSDPAPSASRGITGRSNVVISGNIIDCTGQWSTSALADCTGIWLNQDGDGPPFAITDNSLSPTVNNNIIFGLGSSRVGIHLSGVLGASIVGNTVVPGRCYIGDPTDTANANNETCLHDSDCSGGGTCGDAPAYGVLLDAGVDDNLHYNNGNTIVGNTFGTPFQQFDDNDTNAPITIEGETGTDPSENSDNTIASNTFHVDDSTDDGFGSFCAAGCSGETVESMLARNSVYGNTVAQVTASGVQADQRGHLIVNNSVQIVAGANKYCLHPDGANGLFEDANCDGVKDGGEELIGQAAGGLAADSVDNSHINYPSATNFAYGLDETFFTIGQSTGGIATEGNSAGDDIEGFLIWPDIGALDAADSIWVLPDLGASGGVGVLVSNGSNTVLNLEGDGLVSAATVLGIELVADGDGVASALSSSESGLEFEAGKLGLLRGCSDALPLLHWTDASESWGCASDAGGGGGDAWSDPVDADILPDVDSTRTIGATANRFVNIFLDALDVGANITVGGTVDGRDLATDGSKLDGIESSATADQTGAEIKTAYELEADTNAYDDAAVSKLAGIEALADVTDTANVTSAGALMDSEVDADIQTLTLPANTTITTFGESLIDDANAAAGLATLGAQASDADLDDLADGSLTGSKVGTGISGTNISTGTVADARIAATIARDSEIKDTWNTTIGTADSANYNTNLDSGFCERFDVAATITDLNCYCVGTSCSEDVDINEKSTPNGAAVDVCTGSVTADEDGATCTLSNTDIDAGDWLCLEIEDGTPAAVPVVCTLNGTWD